MSLFFNIFSGPLYRAWYKVVAKHLLKDGKKELEACCEAFGFSHFSWQSFKMALSDPHLLVFMSLCELFPSYEPCSDSFLTHGTWKEYRVSLVKWGDVENEASILCALFCCLRVLMEAGCHIESCTMRGPGHVARSWGRLLVTSCLRPSAQCPGRTGSCPQPLCELWSRWSVSWAFRWDPGP